MTRHCQRTKPPHLPTDRESCEALSQAFERGDAASIGAFLNIGEQRVSEWLANTRRNPLETVALIVEQLRRNGSPRAEEPFIWLARRLGYLSHRVDASTIDDKALAEVLLALGHVIEAKAEAERDGLWTVGELRGLAGKVMRMAESAISYARSLLCRASDLEAHPHIRSIS